MSNLPVLDEIGAGAEFVSVQISYHDRLLFPAQQGLEYINSLAGCLLIESEGYGKERVETIKRFDKELKVIFHSREEIEELIAAQTLLLQGDPNA